MTEGRQVKEVSGLASDTVGATIKSVAEPLVLRGLVSSWPVVRASKESPQAVADYIRRFYSGDRVTAFRAPPEVRGRIGYNDELTGFSFKRTSATLDEVLDPLFEHIEEENPPAQYVGSTLLDRWFPGFRQENDLKLDDRQSLVSIWLGNRTRVSAHFDVADNIACCVAGRRRFTLFPPEQLANLYVGPWDKTPAGQPISLVDFSDPDFERFPRFREALDTAYTVTLEPGDALCIPSMWWHHVEGLEAFNVLVNYWWRTTPRFMGSPQNAFKHAILALRELPLEQRQAWRRIFDYYVFGDWEEACAHIPEQSRGILGPLNDVLSRQLRADLLNQLNR